MVKSGFLRMTTEWPHLWTYINLCVHPNSGSQRCTSYKCHPVVKGIKVIYRTLYLSKYDDRINIKIHKDVKWHLYDKK